MNRLNELLSQWNITLSEKQISQFQKYYDLLIEWNSVMNLTAITEFDEVITKHFVDSLALVHFCKTDNCMILDMGTGAGFPGIPIKIANPSAQIVLADSLQKRIKFLNAVISELQLEGISAVHGRAEELARQDRYREKFDICTSRAVANMATLSEYCLPFVKIGGVFAAYKSEKTAEELSVSGNAISLLGGKINHVEEYRLPCSDIGRTLVLIDKCKSTSKKYPRKAGTPSKEPLM